MTDDPIAAARAIRSTDEARELYRRWAHTYDHDVFDRLEVVGTRTIAELLSQHVADRTTPIIDLGCGTGAAGLHLRDHGFTTIDGADLSPEMLDIAATKGSYRHLVAVDLNDEFVLPAPTYGASISAGTFVSGHVGPGAVERISDYLAPQATVAWVINPALWPAFELTLKAAGFGLVHHAIEPVRRNGPPDAVMVVASRSPDSGSARTGR
jgi:SAM-dependent methyltransferase